jgi:hypothetical protein
MIDYLTIVQDVRRQTALASIIGYTNPSAAKTYAEKIMVRAVVSDCGRATDKQVSHASDLAEKFLFEFCGSDYDD